MYHQCTRDKRVALAALLRAGESQTEAARCLGVSTSTICRELTRNRRPDGRYDAGYAHKLARARRKGAKRSVRLIENNPVLARQIETLLHPLRSPEVVAHEVGIVHETIYAWMARSRPDLYGKLPYQGRKRRRYGTKRLEKQGWTRYVRSIDERPAVAERRGRIGDFEGDTMRGRNGHLLPHVDRRSLYMVADLVPNEGADVAHERTKNLVRFNPHTITYDRGSTFALWEMTERDTGAKIYFANARHPWERGTCENTIGRLRRVFPKGFDFSTITQKDVDETVWRMNHTKRKRLNWRTPCEVFGKCCTSS